LGLSCTFADALVYSAVSVAPTARGDFDAKWVYSRVFKSDHKCRADIRHSIEQKSSSSPGDIARFTGGKAVREGLELQLNNIQISDLGQARKITVDKNNTMVEGGFKLRPASVTVCLEGAAAEPSRAPSPISRRVQSGLGTKDLGIRR